MAQPTTQLRPRRRNSWDSPRTDNEPLPDDMVRRPLAMSSTPLVWVVRMLDTYYIHAAHLGVLVFVPLFFVFFFLERPYAPDAAAWCLYGAVLCWFYVAEWAGRPAGYLGRPWRHSARWCWYVTSYGKWPLLVRLLWLVRGERLAAYLPDLGTVLHFVATTPAITTTGVPTFAVPTVTVPTVTVPMVTVSTVTISLPSVTVPVAT